MCPQICCFETQIQVVSFLDDLSCINISRKWTNHCFEDWINYNAIKDDEEGEDDDDDDDDDGNNDDDDDNGNNDDNANDDVDDDDDDDNGALFP